MISNWADDLIEEYREGRTVLKKMKEALGDSERDKMDRTQINSMIREMTETIKWLRTGRDPQERRGAGITGVYQLNHLSNMDLLPDITSQLQEGERESLEIGEEEKRIIIQVFATLSKRERDCFILHTTQDMSMSEIAIKHEISKSAVQIYINRAREKIKKIKEK